jgi:hypothetical protein
MPRVPAVRTTGWVDREYGREKWPAVLARVDQLLAMTPAISLERAVTGVARAEHLGDSGGLERSSACLGGRLVVLERAMVLAAWRAFVVESVLAWSDPQPDLILELGSGWGRNLFDVWSAGGPAESRYVGAELTRSGRTAAERLASLEPRMNFTSVSFDFRSVDLAALRTTGSAVVLTAYAIQQVPWLAPDVLSAIATIADRVVCIHLEDIGWQIPDRKTVGSSAEYAAANDYNRNLYKLVSDARASGALEVLDIRTDVIGLNPRDAASLVVWRPGQRSWPRQARH